MKQTSSTSLLIKSCALAICIFGLPGVTSSLRAPEMEIQTPLTVEEMIKRFDDLLEPERQALINFLLTHTAYLKEHDKNARRDHIIILVSAVLVAFMGGILFQHYVTPHIIGR